MKKIIVGIVWQILGFLGTGWLWLYAARIQWNYDVIKTLVEGNLLFPFIVSIIMFIAGIITCLIEMNNNWTNYNR